MGKASAPKIVPATSEWVDLAEALEATVTPCRGSDAWTSEKAAARAAAVLACRACPVIELCASAAQSTRERFGVWGAVDRTKTTREAVSA